MAACCLLPGALFAEDPPSPNTPPKPPTLFNPDPGAWNSPSPQTVADNVEFTLSSDDENAYGTDPLPPSLALPRGQVMGLDPVHKIYTYRQYPLGREGLGLLPNSAPVPNRWLLPFPHWQRYQDPSRETPYMYETPRLWHPYEQSRLKGDVPVIGQDIFLNLTGKNFSIFEARRLPVPSGVSTARPNSSEFFGLGDQFFISTDTSLAIDIFRGETAFKPVSWLLRMNVVENENFLWVRENNLIDPDPRGVGFDGSQKAPDTSKIGAIPGQSNDVNPKPGDPGVFNKEISPGDMSKYLSSKLDHVGETKNGDGKSDSGGGNTRYTYRHMNVLALQEAFLEFHLKDISDNYDFISTRTGIQPFVSDFRGFIFADTNLGFLLFGSADDNRLQYNLVYFDEREKDTYSDLNTFDSRGQQVFIANVYRQDFLFKGYTTSLSFHANLDDGETHYDRNGFLVRPSVFGSVPADGNYWDDDGGPRGHDLRAYYLGWAGDGHIGKLNISHAFYQVLGRDDFNAFAGRSVDINAQMAALELSLDRDWIRFKLSGFYASGDRNPTDSQARGFDSIQDNPMFFGGPFSWFVHQGFNLAGTAVDLKERNSLVTALRSSKSEGQANFVNPGVIITGLGTDMDLTPKLKLFGNLNYVWLAEPKAIDYALQTNGIRRDLGLDASLGVKLRPLLTDNVILSAGVGFFFPGGGYRDIYRQSTVRVPGYDDQENPGKVDRFLYNVFVGMTLTY